MSGRHPPPPRRLYGRQEAAIYLRISEKLFTQLVKMGIVPAPKMISTGHTLLQRWVIEDLDQFIDALPSLNADGRPTPVPPKLLRF